MLWHSCSIAVFCTGATDMLAPAVKLAPPCANAVMDVKENTANKNIAVAEIIVVYLFLSEIEEIQV